jgi:hypothetical protein
MSSLHLPRTSSSFLLVVPLSTLSPLFLAPTPKRHKWWGWGAAYTVLLCVSQGQCCHITEAFQYFIQVELISAGASYSWQSVEVVYYSWPYRDSNSDPSVVQPVASRYTDWAIPAPNISMWGKKKR